MYSSSHEIEQGLWLSKFLSKAKRTECRHEKGQGLRLLKLPWHRHCLENVWHDNKMYFTKGQLP